MDNFYTYSSSLYNTGLFQFDSVYSGNITDVTQTSSGSGVHNYRDLTLNLRIQDRDGQEVTDARDFLKSAFLTESNISILEPDGSVAYANYQSGYKQSSFTFTEQNNIDIFGFYAPHFGIKTEIKDRDDNVTTSEFYFYGNRPRVSSVTVTDTATGHKFTSSAGSASTQVLSGVSGQLKIDFDFLNSPEYTNFDHVDIYWASGSTYFDSNPLSADHLAATKTLSQNKNQSVFLFEENVPQFTGSDLYLTIKPYSTIGLGDQWTVGPFKFEYAEKPNTNYLTEISSGDVTGALGFTPLSPSESGISDNFYLTGANFDTSNGVLTLSVDGAADQTADLDGRYGLSSYVSANTSNISTNTSNISTNTSSINTLSGYVTSNTTNVGNNTTAINTISGDLYTLDLQDVCDADASTTTAMSIGGLLTLGNGLTTNGSAVSTFRGPIYSLHENGIEFRKNARSKIYGDSSEGDSALFFESDKAIFNVSGASDQSGNRIFSYGSAILLGTQNLIKGDYDAIVAGTQNTISGTSSGNFSFIGAGSGIDIIDSDYSSSIGGVNNDISGSDYAVIGGGKDNSIVTSDYGFIGGGLDNTVSGAAGAQVFGSYVNVTNQGAVYLSDNDNRTKQSDADDALFLDFSGGVFSKTGEFNIAGGDFSVDGSNGRLFGVTDEVTGTVFSVNDAAGLPIVEVESTSTYDKITMGEYGSDLIVLSGQTSAQLTGSQIASESWVASQGYLTSETDDQTLQEILDATPSATGTINVDAFSGVSGVLDVIQATGDLTLRPLGSDGNGGKLILDGDSFTTALQIENNGHIDWGATTYRFGLGSTYWQWKSWSKPIEIQGGAGTVMYIGTPAGDGNVGIGTTSPAAKLHVQSLDSNVLRLANDEAVYDSSQEIGIDFYGRWYSSQPSVLKAKASIVALGDTDGYQRGQLSFRVANDGAPSEAVRIDRQGNVGIGTNSPSAALTIKGSANDSTFRLNSFSGSGYIDALMGNTPYFRLYQSNGNRLQIGAGDGNINRFNSSNTAIDLSFATNGGNVGIGTTDPDSRLHVVGSIDSDAASLGSEIVASQTASGTNWSGSSLASGYTHSAGSTDLLVSNLTPTVNRLYRVEIQTTNVTAGRLDKVFFGGIEYTVYITSNLTRVITVEAANTDPLKFECQSAFVGTVTVNSVKEIEDSSPMMVLSNSDNTAKLEARVYHNNNFFLGKDAGNNIIEDGVSNYNLGIGRQALKNATISSFNTAIGHLTLGEIGNGSYNVALGYNVLNNYQKNGNLYNIGIGVNLLNSTTLTGQSNIFMGFWSGGSATTASNNVVIGYNALGDVTSGGSNVALGHDALHSLTTGGSNAALGRLALYNITTAAHNTAIGYNAGRYAVGNVANQTGSSSVFLGSSTKAAANGETNQIVIGYNAEGIGANTVTLGNDNVVTTALKGNVGIGTTSPSNKLTVTTSTTSDGVFIETSQPVTYAKLFNSNSESFPVGNLNLSYGPNSTAVIVALSNRMSLKGGYTTGGQISFLSASSEIMRMTSTGLGIGTTAPALQSGGTGLHINAASNSELKFTNNTTGTTASDGTALVSSGSNFTINNREAGSLTFGTSNTVALTIDSSQNATFAGDLTVAGGDITLGGTGRIQGVDTVTDATDAANKAYVDAQVGSADTLQEVTDNGNTFSADLLYTNSGTAQKIDNNNYNGLMHFNASRNIGFHASTADVAHIHSYSETHFKFGSSHNSANTTAMLIKSDGKVGIGTTSPAQKLDVQGTILVNNEIQLVDSNMRIFRSSNDLRLRTGGIDRVTINSTGKVGIGTTSPTKTFEVVPSNGGFAFLGGGDVTAQSITDSTRKFARIGTPHYYNSEEPMLLMVGDSDSSSNIINIGGGSAVGNAATAIKFYTAANNVTTNGTERMRINSSGNIGIGTASPASLLHIFGGAATLEIDSSTNQANLDFDNSTQTATIRLGNNDLITLVGGSEKMRVLANGNVGIGTTSPAEKLEVVGQAIIDGGVGVNSSGTLHLRQKGNTNADGLAITSAHATSHRIWKDVNGKLNIGPSTLPSSFVQDLSGNVGIGIATPAQKLEVFEGYIRVGDASNVGYGIEFERNSAIVGLINTANGRINIQTSNNGDVELRDTAGTGNLILKHGGNVGIGTTSPNTKLHVEGNTPVIQIRETSGTAEAGISMNHSVSGNHYNWFLGTLDGSPRKLTIGATVTDGHSTNTAQAAASLMLLDQSTGNVGIGTTSPSKKLEVTGDIKASATVEAARVHISSDLRHAGDEDTKLNFGTDTINLITAGTTALTVDSSSDVTVNNDLVVSGNFTVNGTTSTINSTTVQVDDKNIELGTVATPTDTTADGGGITLKGATDKTINWVNSTDAWTFSHKVSTSEITTASGTLTLNPAGSYVFLPSGKKLYGSNIGFGYQSNAVSAIKFLLGASIDNPDMRIERSSSNLLIQNEVDNGDILFKGSDGGSTITALTLDMSNGGDATFGRNLIVNNTITTPTDTNLSLSPNGSGHIYLGDSGNGMNLYHYSNANDGKYTGYDFNGNYYRISTTATSGIKFEDDVTSTGSVTAPNLTLTNLSTYSGSEITALMIDGSNIVGKRALGSNAFNSTAYLPLAGGTMTGAIAMGNQNITGGGSFFANLFSVGNEGKVVSTSTLGLQLQATGSQKPIIFSTNDGGMTERMRVHTDGNVGIGTTSPTAQLQSVAPDGSKSSLRLGRSDTSIFWDFNHAGGDLRIWSSAASGSDILLGVDAGGTVKNNKVGIGTASPTAKLHVQGTSFFFDQAIFDDKVGIGTTSPADKLEIKASTNAGTIRFKQPDGSAPFVGATVGTAMVFQTYGGVDKAAIYVDNSNNFTIGGADIHLDGVASGNRFKALTGGALSSPSIQLDDTIGDESGLYLPATNNIGIITDRLERVRIDASGYVGIGTTTPATPLHVTGEVRVDATQGVAARKIRSNYFSSGQNLDLVCGASASLILGDGTARLTLASDDSATFAGSVNISTPASITPNTGASELVVGSGVGSQGITIYSGDTSAGSIHFADDLDEEGAGDNPAGNRDGVIIYSHNTNDFNFKTAGNQQALQLTNSNATFAGSVTAPNLTLTNLSSYSGSEITALMIDGSNIVGKRALGTNAFNSTSYLPLAGGTMSGDLILDDGSGNSPTLRFQDGSDIKFNLYSDGNSLSITRDGNGGADFTLSAHATDYTNSSFTIGGATVSPTTIGQWNTAYNYSQVGHLPLAGGTITGNVRFNDTIKAEFGSGADLQINHDGTQSLIDNGTGNLTIQNQTNDGDIIFKSDDGSGGITPYLTLDGSSTGLTVSAPQGMVFFDNIKAKFGNNDDLQIFHDGSNSYLQNVTGDLYIQNGANDKDVILRSDDGSGGQTEYLRLDGGQVKTIFSKTTIHNDGVEAQFGNGADLKIYHTGTNSYIDDIGTGSLYIRGANDVNIRSYNGGAGEQMIKAIANGAVELYYDNSKKFETTSTGVDIAGHLSATTKSFLVDNPKTGGKLQYGVVESDEHGVYVRGKSDQEVVELPEEWDWLVHEDSVTVQLTSVGQMQQLFIVEQNNKRIKVSGLAPNGQYNYVVHGTRKDVDALEKHLK